MGCYHFHLNQLSRSHGQSAMASAAYRAGERLYSTYYGEMSDYTRKGGVVLSEIHLPPFAPERLRDRQTLWNEVEWAEKNKRAQLAHSFDIALMNEFSMEENIELARRFVEEQLVSRGMIADLAIHDPKRSVDKEPNTHMHVMVPIRPLNEDGTWGIKQRKIPVVNEEGSLVLKADGTPKMAAVPVKDWSSKETLIELRKAWADLCNEHYREKGLQVRVDWRSYEELGIDQIPTIHEGPAIRAMEARGIETSLGSMNRLIRQFNEMLRTAKTLLKKVLFSQEQLKEKLSKAKKPTIAEYLLQYYHRRDLVAETFGYGTQKAKTTNLKEFTSTIAFLERENIETPEELTERITKLEDEIRKLKEQITAASDELNQAREGMKAWNDYQTFLPVYKTMRSKTFFKNRFKEEHATELKRYYRAKRILDEMHIEDGKIPSKAWEEAAAELPDKISDLRTKRKAIFEELHSFQKVQKSIDAVLTASPQSDEAGIKETKEQPDQKAERKGIHASLNEKKKQIKENKDRKTENRERRNTER